MARLLEQSETGPFTISFERVSASQEVPQTAQLFPFPCIKPSLNNKTNPRSPCLDGLNPACFAESTFLQWGIHGIRTHNMSTESELPKGILCTATSLGTVNASLVVAPDRVSSS
jgi:hypothetical protein